MQSTPESGGDVDELQRRLDAIRPEIEAIDTASMRMRLAFTEVAMFSRTDTAAMEEGLKRAYREARTAEDNQHSTVAATKLTEFLALYIGDPRAALEWAEVALAESERPGVAKSTGAAALLAIAITHDIAGNWDEAAKAYDSALAAADALGADRDRRRGNVLISICGFEGARGNLDRASRLDAKRSRSWNASMVA